MRQTDEDIDRCVDLIMEMVVTGADNKAIVNYLTEQTGVPVEERQIYRYIARAKQQIKKEASFNRKERFGQSLMRLDLLFRKTIEDKHWKTALLVQREINSLLGLNIANELIDKIKEIEDLINSKPLGEYSHDELSAIRARLEQQRNKANQIRGNKPQAA